MLEPFHTAKFSWTTAFSRWKSDKNEIDSTSNRNFSCFLDQTFFSLSICHLTCFGICNFLNLDFLTHCVIVIGEKKSWRRESKKCLICLVGFWVTCVSTLPPLMGLSLCAHKENCNNNRLIKRSHDHQLEPINFLLINFTDSILL